MTRTNTSENAAPDKVRAILRGSLTERGINQWWTRRNRHLDDVRPCDLWARDRQAVIDAANAFGEGYYT